MKKILLTFTLLLASFLLFGCKGDAPAASPLRYENLAIRPGTEKGSIAIAVSALKEDATIYYLITDYDALSPTADQVKAGQSYEGVTVHRFGQAIRRLLVEVTGLGEEVTYMVHTVIHDGKTFSDVQSRRVLTKNEFQAGLFGAGTEEDPFQINAVWQLELIGTDEYGYGVNNHYILTSDIDLADGGYGPEGKSWVPIGKQNGMNRKFGGVFDGNGHTIYNLHIDVDTGTEKWGLFQETNFDSVIKDVHLENVYVRASGFRIAGLVGYAKGSIYNVSVMNAHIEQISGEGQVGAIVGAFYDTGTLFRATSDAQIIATGRRVGGLVGAATTNSGYDAVRIFDVSFTGSLEGTDVTSRQYGGILGAGTAVILTRAHSSASISAVRQVGGIVGYIEGISTVTAIISDTLYTGTALTANGIDGNTTVGIARILGDASITKGPYEVHNSYANEATVIQTVGNNASRRAEGTSFDVSTLNEAFFSNNLSDFNFSSVWRWSMNDLTLRFNKN